MVLNVLRDLFSMLWRLGREDRRRVIHSVKAGVALSVISLLYLTEPLFEKVGQNAIWAVMTVVVVLEFTAGATLCKGLNRGFGTLTAGLLAVIVEYMADFSGRIGEAIVIGVSVFIVGFTATFIRFVPQIKRSYDYGAVVFLLTFNLIIVSGYRVQNSFKLAGERFYNIAIGCGVCLVMTLLFFPIWAGDDLHKSTASKIEGIANSLQGCITQYFQDPEKEVGMESSEEAVYEGYRTILDSKSIDESLAMYASWEPRMYRPCLKYQWDQYIQVGAALRHLSYTIVALQGCLQSEIQTPQHIKAIFIVPALNLSTEARKVLMELANSVRTRQKCQSEALIESLRLSLEDFTSAIRDQPRLFIDTNNKITENPHPKLAQVLEETPKSEQPALCRSQSKILNGSLEFSEALSFASFASLVVDAIARVERVVNSVDRLAKLANFRECSLETEHVVDLTPEARNQQIGHYLSSHSFNQGTE